MVHRFVPRCQFGCGCGWFGHGSVPCVGVVCWWLLVGGESTVSRQWVQPPVLHAEPGAGPVVCARWCPTLPHPGGCSTIGAVRLSFRVRDGSGRFPVAVTTETTTWAVRGRRLWYESIRLSVMAAPLATHALARGVCGWSGWVGCGPYSGRFAFLLFHSPPPPHVVCGVCWGVVVCVGLLVPVSSSTVAGLPLLAYQPSSLLGAYQKGQVLLVETLS